jgi:GT2 family glycosyltransferase
VVVPVADGGAAFGACLAALGALNPAPVELIVVSDASTDESAARAVAAGATVIRMARRLGPAAARNRGASRASGDVLFFVDADVVVHPDAIAHVGAVLSDPAVDAVIGSYDSRPAAPGLVSQYKNLVHHFLHQSSDPAAFTFWGACGAIRRDVFASVGGFDERYVEPSIEDIELGYRLRRAGHRIRLDRTLEVTHLKRWTLGSLIRTDIRARAVPWSALLIREGRADDGLNLRVEARIAVALAWVTAVCAALSTALDGVWPVAAIAALVLAALDIPLWRHLLQLRGSWFLLRAMPLHWLYYLYCGASFGYVLTRHLAAGGGRRVEPA